MISQWIKPFGDLKKKTLSVLWLPVLIDDIFDSLATVDVAMASMLSDN